MERVPVTDPRRQRRRPTHPAHVTADRLKAHAEQWNNKLTGQERDEFAAVIQALEEIGGGER